MTHVDKKNLTRTGVLSVHRDGYAFLLSEDPGAPDVFIPRRAVGHALHGDRVTARIVPPAAPRRRAHGRRTPGPTIEDRIEGEVVQIIARALTRLVGHFDAAGPTATVTPDDSRIPFRVKIPADGRGGARHGQAVAVQVLDYPGSTRGFTGKVIQILGARGVLETEVAAVIHHHALADAFPDEIEHEAERLATARQAEGLADEKRRDLRALPLVTIDGETAKDFDDAIHVARLDDDNARVHVAIADVSWFVQPGRPIDQEALARGTSVYFPDRALPMLPHRLSDDVCSLRPDEDRLALVAEFTVTEAGKIHSPEFYRAVIRSHARLTYTQVHAVVEQRRMDARRALAAPVVAMLDEAAGVCRRLRHQRRARGSIDFDLPEPEIVLDLQGGPEAILRAPRYFSHQMIEELMIAANETVAQHLTRKGRGCIYRVHPLPAADRLQDFNELLHHLQLGVRVSLPPQARELARVVEAARGHPAERLINHTLLRAMAQAYYDPKNIGHFGLASKCYCHFTSPIRRYPDLIIHRLLIETLTADHASRTEPKVLLGIAQHTSRRERIAMEAEREMIKLYATAFLQARIGQTFDGVVAHATPKGYFIELKDYFVEGFLPASALQPPGYRLARQRPPTPQLEVGTALRVKVAEASLESRQVEFALAE